MDLKSTLRTSLKIVIPLVFGGLLLWLIYRNMDIKAIWEVIRRGVRYDIIAFSLLFGLLANIFRGLRWSLLIDSLNMPHNKVRAVSAVLGTYAVNLVLPRMGEVWRCGIVTKYDKIPFTKLFGTLLIDRISDVVVVGLVTVVLFFSNLSFFTNFSQRNPELLDGFHSIFTSLWIYVCALIIIAAVWFVFRYMSSFALVRKVKNMLKNVWLGVKSIWLLEDKMKFLLQTVIIWVCYFFYFYITFYAFDFTRELGFHKGLIAFTMSSIAVAIPVQGGIGPWHFMVISTLVLFNVVETDAAAFAAVVHTLQTAWTGLCGLGAILALPLINRKDKTQE
ncbi:flippase-like domain-containing protein [Parabacteroides sp. OttesenSCG-928-K15]|nr:flippase-like domain-containing protein [Parabacteroides sp. OttesenSCG-928-K15]